MSQDDPRNNVLTKLGEALLEAIKGLHPIFRFILAFAILIVMVIVLQAVIPKEVLPLFYLLPALGLVGYLVLELRLRQEKRPEPADEPMSPVSTEHEPEQAQPAGQEPLALDPTAAQQSYLRRLQTVCNTLLLQYIRPESLGSEQVRRQVMRLIDVYTTLDTTVTVRVKEEEGKAGRRARAREQSLPGQGEETRLYTALEAAAEERQMVLLGDPGSGKSTFVKHLALCLAGEQLEPGRDWLRHLQPIWGHGPLFPLLVVLRDFARSGQCDGSAGSLWQFVARDLGEAASSLEYKMRHEGGVLVLLDGLDEVSDEGERTRVRDAVRAFAEQYNHLRNRYLVTCRIYAYQDRRWQLPETFPAFTLAPFSDERIDAFIDAWYQEVHQLAWKNAAEAKELAGRLKQAARRQGLDVLARRPLLLTVMALLHTTSGRLPDDRVKLYAETVELLLERWQEARLGEESGLNTQVNRERLEAALEKVTFEAHLGQKEGEGIADIAEKDLREALAACCPAVCGSPGGSWDQAGALIAYIKERAGLLFEREPGVYTFPHRTFQEYLAAAYLCVQPAYPQEAARLLRENPAQWREVFMMAAGIMARLKRMPYVALYAVNELCPAGLPETAKAWQEVSEGDWRAAWHAGEALLEIDPDEAARTNAQLVERVRGWLVALVEHGALAPVERAAAGNVLSQLGDPRFRADAWHLPDELLLGFVEVPAGPFPMGTRDQDIPALLKRFGGERRWYEWETPQHERKLPRYYVARYPVTVAQFRAFVQGSGYRAQGRWEAEGEFETHPVVNVTWYDAVAYCRWLTEKLRAWQGTPEPLASLLREKNWQIMLPSEAQWEKAARGPLTEETVREFPWGDVADPKRANYGETGIGTTSAVGIFPGGASPYGVLDMAGNVWEWCATKWEDNYRAYRDDNGPAGTDARVLRGGAFYDSANGVRCAFRLVLDPDFRFRGGFRVVLAPG